MSRSATAAAPRAQTAAAAGAAAPGGSGPPGGSGRGGAEQQQQQQQQQQQLWASPGGKKFHRAGRRCGGLSGAAVVAAAEIARRGLEPCRLCRPATGGTELLRVERLTADRVRSEPNAAAASPSSASSINRGATEDEVRERQHQLINRVPVVNNRSNNSNNRNTNTNSNNSNNSNSNNSNSNNSNSSSNNSNNNNLLTTEVLARIREELVDPITQELPDDPVVCKWGHVFEREAIAAWIAHAGTHPLRRTPLAERDLTQRVRGIAAVVQQLRRLDGGSAHEE
jgi:hypothetical protein